MRWWITSSFIVGSLLVSPQVGIGAFVGGQWVRGYIAQEAPEVDVFTYAYYAKVFFGKWINAGAIVLAASIVCWIVSKLLARMIPRTLPAGSAAPNLKLRFIVNLMLIVGWLLVSPAIVAFLDLALQLNQHIERGRTVVGAVSIMKGISEIYFALFKDAFLLGLPILILSILVKISMLLEPKVRSFLLPRKP
jgi:hypothetical protein